MQLPSGSASNAEGRLFKRAYSAARLSLPSRLVDWIHRKRFGVALGLLIVAAASIAQQAMDVEGSWLDSFESEVMQLDSGVTATSFAGVPDQTVVSLASELPVHDATVGTLAGNAGVSGGAATYTIPIAVPPGRRGMQPDLSLSYSSRAGNGVAGMGWSLSGLSSISRCPSTLDQDNVIRAVELDAADKLCLDGQRLIATSGLYGQSGATYATEIESFSRVTQLGGALNSAATYFKVETKSGDIVYYGGTSAATNAARVIPGNVTLPMSWLIERRQDRVGNLVRYAYVSYGSGETLLSKVLYTGFGTSDGDRSVEMAYETRPTTTGSNDQSSSYLAGGLSRQSQRLWAVTTKVGTQAVRSYQLAYELSGATGRSLLKSVTDCAFAGTQPICRPATTFTWQSQPLQYRFGKLQLSPAAGVPNLNWEFATSAGGGDFNGDGARDVFGVAPDPASPGSKVGYLLTLSPERKVTAALKIDPNSPLRSYGLNADFDLDGRTDVVSYDANKNIVIWFWHGPANATSTSQALTDSWNTGIGDPLGFILHHVEDMNGDGRPDLITQRDAPSPSDGCRRVAETYLNRANAAGPGAQATFEKTSSFCLRSRSDSYGRQYMWEKIRSIFDFNGDGLPEIFVNETGHVDDTQYRRFYWGCNGTALCASGYAQVETYFNSTLLPTDPRINYVSMLAAAGVPPDEDVNSDGLNDWFSPCGIRLNTAKGFAACGTITSQDNGVPSLPLEIGNARKGQADLNGDGRLERLWPGSYAGRYCTKHIPACPIGQDDESCNERYLCPEDAATGILPFRWGMFDGAEWRVSGLYKYSNGAYINLDSSVYRMNASRYVEIGPNQFRSESFTTSILHGLTARMGEDLFGDGLVDGVTRVDCQFSDDGECSIPSAALDPVGAELGDFPTLLPDGSPALSRGIYINENLGPDGVMSPDGLTPQTPDLMAAVTTGLGVETVWTYYPLSSKAGRTAGETPLYSIPSSTASRYIDDRHFYFTSSMPVVSDMIQSDGIGDYRSWRYGYSEAMYHARGRGFQGFRTIIEEDEAAGTRTTTTFHQKFPLTSQPESVIVNSLKRSGATAPISKKNFTWRCNRANRADAAACTPPSGTATVKFPFLDTTETWAYDAATADNPSGGTPAQLSYRKEVAADDTTCSGTVATTSGYDAYGNLTASNVVTADGAGSGGYRAFVTAHRSCTDTGFAAADTTNWWLDKVNTRSVTTAISYHATNHALPAGVANPAQTVTTQYTWNTDRTPATETLQPGIANQQRITTYGYPATNYGLPNSVTVNGSGDPNGNRVGTTTYSADGYFPQTVTNPLGHAATTLTRKEDGQPSQTTDANGLRTLMTYDAFGFATLVRYRGATDAEYRAPDKQAALVRPTGTWPPYSVYAAVEVQDGAPTQWTYVDMLGRVVKVKARLADGNFSHVVTNYNARGQVEQKSEPFKAGLYEPDFYTSFAYDIAGRVTQKVTPQANHDGRGDLITTYAYSGRTTAIQVCGSLDPDTTKCLNLSRTTDSLGRHVETVDAKSGVTRFWYDGSGNALAIKDVKGSVISAVYNALGQRTSVADPNQGAWSFGYNALGEVLSQTDARGIATTTTYDKAGRPKQSSASYAYDDVAGNDTVVDAWTYDPAYGKGLPASNSRTVNTTVLRTETLTYDPLSRPTARAITQRRADNTTQVSLSQQTAYDLYYGRPKAQDYGNGEAVWLRYSQYGHLVRESDANTSADYRVLNTVDARGNPTGETLAGGNLTATRSYAPQTGQMLSTLYGSVANANLRRLEYRYDVYGNVSQQALNTSQTVEAYEYDALHRLTEASRTGATTATATYAYDAAGNFTSKSDFSTTAASAYTYTGGSCGGGPNAVKSVALQAGGTRSYCYDATGNLTSDNAGLAIRYDHTQRPLKITRSSLTQYFDYAPDGMRFRQTGSDGEVAYFGALERRYLPAANDKTYVGGSVVVTTTATTRRVDYLLTDRLGSVDALTNSNGDLLETRGFDVFGKPRNGVWADTTPPRLATTGNTPHGFTGHEHLNQLELIHMNGRVYDYNLGRFLGVDPMIQFPLNSQSLNPYSYILNNPLSGTDPTGYKTCTLTDNKDCLEDGKNTIVDSKGNNLGTVNVGQKNVSFSPNMAGIAQSLKSNGADLVKGAATSMKEGASAIGKRVESVLPGTGQAMQRGELGTLESNKAGFGLGLADPVVRHYNLTMRPLIMMGVLQPLPEVQYENDQLFGRAAVEIGGLAATRGAAGETAAFRFGARAEAAVPVAEAAVTMRTAARGGESAAAAYGRLMHKTFDYGPGFRREYRLDSGRRVDAINFNTRHIVELKPNNPSAIRAGERQVEQYRQEVQHKFGGQWTTEVRTYDR